MGSRLVEDGGELSLSMTVSSGRLPLLGVERPLDDSHVVDDLRDRRDVGDIEAPRATQLLRVALECVDGVFVYDVG